MSWWQHQSYNKEISNKQVMSYEYVILLLKCIVITYSIYYRCISCTSPWYMYLYSTKQVRLMNMSSLGYKYFLLLLSKLILPNSSSLCRCLIFATFLALCLYCDFLSIPLSFLPNRSDNEPDVFFFYLLATSILPCLPYVSRFHYVMMKIFI